MVSVGGALLWYALFLLSISVHSTARSCPLISANYCKKASTGADSGGPLSCGDHLLRCNDSKTEIQFRGLWYKVIGGVEATLDGFELEVESPRLSSLFAGKDCEFLYSFRRPGPLFDPPPTRGKSLPPDILSQRCSKSDYLLFFPKLFPLYLNHNTCSPAYDVHYTCDGEQTSSKNTTSSSTSTPNCQPTPDHPAGVLVWTLSMDNNSTGPDGNNATSADFTLKSVGFSRRHRPRAECFESHEEMAGGHCDPGPAHPVAGKKPPGLNRRLIIGFSTATGAALCMFGTLLLLCRRNNKAKTPSTSPSTVFRTPCSDPFSEIDPEAPCDYYPTHVFRYEELHEATNGFSPSNELDEGGHGAVYQGKLRDGRAVAVKRLYENSFKRAEQFMNEIAILSCVRHPNLVALYGCTSRHSRELVLVYEFIPNGTVADHLHGDRAPERALTWPVRLRIAVETAKALAYLHAVEPQIVHRDVKTKNILLDRDFHVKVADFGLSRFFPVAASYVSTVPQGTPGYVDPDYHRCYQLTDKSDVYSFGVVLAELISSKPAVDITRSSHEINLADMALRRIQSATLDELVDPKLGFQTDWEVRRMIELVAELAMRCLQAEREMRPSMEGVLEVLRGIEDSHRRSGG